MMRALALAVALLVGSTSITAANVIGSSAAAATAPGQGQGQGHGPGQGTAWEPTQAGEAAHILSIELKHSGLLAEVVGRFDLGVIDVLGAFDNMIIATVSPDRNIPLLLEQLDRDNAVREASLLSSVESPATANGLFWVWGLFWAWGDANMTLDEVRTSYASQPQLGSLTNSLPGTGEGVTVAVIDTGVDLDHWLLADRLVPGGWDFVDGDADPSEFANGVDDDGDGLTDEGFGHGTYVASLVAAMAPEATILPIRALNDDGTADAWTIARAIGYAVAQGADVVNLSLGTSDRQRMLKRLISDYAEVQNIVFVAAAGNTGAALESYPAAESDVIAVGALDPAGARSGFSAHGPWVDVAVPGTGLAGAYPGGHVITWDGTSASSAVTAGLAARVKSNNPALGAVGVRSRLVGRLSATG